MDQSGNILYKDEYDQIYKVSWETVGTVIDMTTITELPYVWGKPQAGYIKNGIIFRKGVVSVTRHVLRILESGYEIVAEGTSQYVDYIQATFPCGPGPVDKFKYHLDHFVVDEDDFRMVNGSRWADSEELNDEFAIWGDVNMDGSPVDLTATGGVDILNWIDVWS